MNELSINQLIESSGNDIRQVINIMQMWNVQGGNSNVSTTATKDDKVMLNNFDAA